MLKICNFSGIKKCHKNWLNADRGLKFGSYIQFTYLVTYAKYEIFVNSRFEDMKKTYKI